MMQGGFISGCRPWIGVDGCHLKGETTGVLLTAVGIDPNNDPYPLAYALVSVENKESWEWFLQLLKEDLLIEREYAYTFMSDKQKGLIGAFQNVLPNVDNRFCVLHLHGNMKRAGFTGDNFRKLLWKAAKATTVPAFQRVMSEIEGVDKRCVEWLTTDKSPTEWSRSHFSTFVKCDTLVNNMCEQFNKCILDARDKPVLTMLEWIREYMMSRLQKNRDRCERKWEGRLICPRIRLILDSIQKVVGDCTPIKSTNTLYEVAVQNGSRFIVNLETQMCDCRGWELSGIPCKHALCAISAEGKDPEEYVHSCYRVETYNAVYEHAISPMASKELWKITGYLPPLPPKFGKKKRGRPVRERRQCGISEEQPKKKRGTLQKLPRQCGKVTCKNCGEKGHNQLSCQMRKDVDEATHPDPQPQPQLSPKNADKEQSDSVDTNVCGFCKDIGHDEDNCMLRKQIQWELALEDEMLEKIQEKQPADSYPEKQPDASQSFQQLNASQSSQQPIAFQPSQVSTKPTTKKGRKALVYQRAKKAMHKVVHEKMVAATPSESYSISNACHAQPKKMGVQIRAHPPMSFISQHVAASSTSIVAPLPGSKKLFTQDGKKFMQI